MAQGRRETALSPIRGCRFRLSERGGASATYKAVKQHASVLTDHSPLQPRAMLAAAIVCALSGLVCSLGSAPTASAEEAGNDVTPFPVSEYSIRPACGPVFSEQARCLALPLLPVRALTRAHTIPDNARALRPATAAEGSHGLRPQDFHGAYRLPVDAEAAQTIGIVDAYDDPDLEQDLAVYDREFSLPECTTANGCFAKLNQSGQSAPLPTTNGEWAMEESLDVEVAHAICESCRVLIVEAESNGTGALQAAENTAVLAGATGISNSWAGAEPETDSAAFDYPGIAITAAAGDDGYLNWDAPAVAERGSVEYPASSPHVVSVGGTRLLLGPRSEWAGETVWNSGDGATGGGCSTSFAAPPWQQSLGDWDAVGCGTSRAVADVAADGDPYTGAAVYDSTPWDGEVLGWLTVGGTSLSSPLIAATFALAGGGESLSGYSAENLYEGALADPGAFHDVTSGSNGECAQPPGPTGESGCTSAEAGASCADRAICVAGPAYSGTAGVGTPSGLGGFVSRGRRPAPLAPPGTPEAPTTGVSPRAVVSRRGSPRARPLRLSRLELTPSAISKMRSGHIRLSDVAFTFAASATGHRQHRARCALEPELA